ncbi:MAG: hypothetical protein RLZZ383_476 [Pseudomonadota bacterium]|jgi:hypothetical protein
MRGVAMASLVGLGVWLAGCDKGQDMAPPPEPGVLVAGIAEARLPAPVGIGTAGFGPFGAPSSQSPFSEIYPGTKKIQGHPGVKVVALSRGDGFEAIFVRLDAVGVFAQLRGAIVDEVSARLGRDMDDALIIGATHTHSGPGRVLNTGTDQSSFFDFIVDKFFPEFYERFVDTIADTIVAAIDDARPAKLGTAVGLCEDAHNDRRCEDGEDYTRGDLPLLAVERDGRVDAVVMAYAIHGTVMGIDDLHLSQDVSGAIETAVADAFDHPVMAVMFNSWGADMAPADPEVPTRAAGVRDEGYERMWHAASAVSSAVQEAWPALSWTETPDIRLSTHRVPINRELLGYTDDQFPYPYGGVYCGNDAGSCEEPGYQEGLDQVCVPFAEAFPAPTQADVTVGRVGAFSLVTFPGEPGTHLAESIMDAMRASDPAMQDALFLGYTQDYLGYSLLEEDWWYGGYEASGALWGPKQGAWLAAQVADRYGAFVGANAAAEEPSRLTPFPYSVAVPYTVDPAQDVGTVVTEVAAEVAADGVVTFALHGGDPWLGAPLARVVDASGAPVARPGGRAFTSDQQDWDVALEVSPAYTSSDAPGTTRTFVWTFRLSPRSPLPGGVDLTGGPWTIEVTVPTEAGEQVVRSAPFTVTSAP